MSDDKLPCEYATTQPVSGMLFQTTTAGHVLTYSTCFSSYQVQIWYKVHKRPCKIFTLICLLSSYTCTMAIKFRNLMMNVDTLH